MAEVVMDEWGTHGITMKADFAQVNLGAVLFAVADTTVDPTPELRTVKISEQAFISLPPFKIVGRIHLLPERDLRLALDELVGAFIPVTDASFWSDTVGEAKQSATMVAFNHARAQILAPHHEIDQCDGHRGLLCSRPDPPARTRKTPGLRARGVGVVWVRRRRRIPDSGTRRKTRTPSHAARRES